VGENGGGTLSFKKFSWLQATHKEADVRGSHEIGGLAALGPQHQMGTRAAGLAEQEGRYAVWKETISPTAAAQHSSASRQPPVEHTRGMESAVSAAPTLGYVRLSRADSRRLGAEGDLADHAAAPGGRRGPDSAGRGHGAVGSHPGTPVWSVQLAATDSALGCARREVRRVVDSWGLDRVAAVAELLALELVDAAMGGTGQPWPDCATANCSTCAHWSCASSSLPTGW
jgi:hypothetical protein